MSQKTITINGTTYDAHTGMPIKNESPQSTPAPATPQPAPNHSQDIHTSTQKSQTLNRRFVKKHDIAPRQTPKIRSDIQKNSSVTKFAPHPSGITPRIMSDIGPVQHQMLTKAHAQLAQESRQKALRSTAAPKPAKLIKEEAIEEALRKSPSHTLNSGQQKQPKSRSRFISVASSALALLLLGGYFTYLNMPNLSVRVAAAQAGVNASYPEYRPDGYSLNGPVAYTQGEVVMKFAANAGPQNFTVSQSKSNWDSSAVLDNYVKEKAGENYIIYNERGLTIYTFDGNAAWVNGGILYTINGDAPLSSDQVRRIATSM